MKEVGACLQNGRVPSSKCKNLSKNVEILVDVYWQGDKTVLPTLLRVPPLIWPGDFYSTALIADSETFLTNLSLLPEKNRQSIALNIAGSYFGVTLPRFDAIRSALKNVPQSSANYHLAQMCLLTLETENASLLINYFPPGTFSGSAQLNMHWFSRDLHLLGEKPLWPPASSNATVYRITVLPAFHGPQSAILNVSPNGTAQIRFHALLGPDSQQLSTDTRAITAQQVTGFTTKLNPAQFWQSPTELTRNGLGLDGADYIFECVRDGTYHVVVRWCPGATKQEPFADVAQQLFDLSGHAFKLGC